MTDSTDPLLAAIKDTKLLDSARIAELAEWVRVHEPSVHVTAAEIARRGWLTQYQIKEIYRGRGRDLILGPYVLMELLGEGGMGRVFKAHHRRLDRIVALKVIRKEKLSKPAVIQRFHQEIQAAALISHPNVVLAFDADEVDGIHYFSMEYVEGVDLTKVVRERGPLPLMEACDIIRQAAQGLQHAHERGLVHRDVKPSNILVTPRGQVKVLDLGLAMLHDRANSGDVNRVTHDGLVLGTPDFLAPEQAQNPTAVDIRADVYALGATLFYLLTGRVPYEGASPTDKLLMHITAPLPNLLQFRPEAPPHLDALVKWFMAKRPEDRPQEPVTAAQALAPYCATAGTGSGTGLGRFLAYGAPQMPAAPYPSFPGGYPAAPAVPAGYPGYPSHPSHHYPPTTPGVPRRQEELPTPLMSAAPTRTTQQQTNPVLAGLPAGRQVPSPQTKIPAPGRPAPYAPVPPGYPQPFAFVDPPLESTGEIELPSDEQTGSRRRRRSWSKKGLLALAASGLIVSVAIITTVVYLLVAKPPPPPTPEFTNSVNMKLVLIHPGSFRMGSAEEEEGRRDDEGPQAQVTLSNPFYIAITETTDHQYQEVMGRSQSEWAKRYARPLNNYVPVDSVSWDEAVDFCRKLNSRDRLRRPGWEYRLPTEAEWEYACRAGTNSPFSYGEKLTVGKHGIYNIDPELGSNVRLANIDPTLGKIEKNRPYPVGWLAPTSSQRSSLKPHEANSWGLFDMHGNVNEWCADFYAPDYVNRPARDPRGPAVGELRVVRGGSWKDPADRCRAAARRGESPDGKFDDVGFRVVLAPIHPR